MYEELIDRLRSRAKQLRHTGGHCNICAAYMSEAADAIKELAMGYDKFPSVHPGDCICAEEARHDD